MPENDAPNVGAWIRDPATRAWAYAVAGAVLVLLVTLGIITDTVAGNVLAIVGALLGTGGLALANRNVPRPPGG